MLLIEVAAIPNDLDDLAAVKSSSSKLPINTLKFRFCPPNKPFPPLSQMNTKSDWICGQVKTKIPCCIFVSASCGDNVKSGWKRTSNPFAVCLLMRSIKNWICLRSKGTIFVVRTISSTEQRCITVIPCIYPFHFHKKILQTEPLNSSCAK
jgi:hypothetical protein